MVITFAHCYLLFSFSFFPFTFFQKNSYWFTHCDAQFPFSVLQNHAKKFIICLHFRRYLEESAGEQSSLIYLIEMIAHFDFFHVKKKEIKKKIIIKRFFLNWNKYYLACWWFFYLSINIYFSHNLEFVSVQYQKYV